MLTLCILNTPFVCTFITMCLHFEYTLVVYCAHCIYTECTLHAQVTHIFGTPNNHCNATKFNTLQARLGICRSNRTSIIAQSHSQSSPLSLFTIIRNSSTTVPYQQQPSSRYLAGECRPSLPRFCSSLPYHSAAMLAGLRSYAGQASGALPNEESVRKPKGLPECAQCATSAPWVCKVLPGCGQCGYAKTCFIPKLLHIIWPKYGWCGQCGPNMDML